MGGNQSCLQKIEFEKHFYANTGLTILDENAVVLEMMHFLGRTSAFIRRGIRFPLK